jgi:hypothetical protein
VFWGWDDRWAREVVFHGNPGRLQSHGSKVAFCRREAFVAKNSLDFPEGLFGNKEDGCGQMVDRMKSEGFDFSRLAQPSHK